MRKNSLLFICLIILLSSCQDIKSTYNNVIEYVFGDKTEITETDKNKPTVRKTYYKKSGDLKTEITVVNNKRHGPAKKYYPTGELHTLIHYQNNFKEGETVWYYKNGNPYRITQYIKGKKERIRKVYYENGKLQAEIPFKNGELVIGTKEYAKNGSIINETRKIIFETNDLVKFEDKYILKMKLSKHSKKVEFFEEKISTNGTKLFVPINTKGGVGTIVYFIAPGSYTTKILEIFVKFSSNLDNPVLKSTSYNLAIDNN